MRTLALLSTLAMLLAAGGCGSSGGDVASNEAESGQSNLNLKLPQDKDADRFADPSKYFISHDQFLAADDPPCVGAEQAGFLMDYDEVLGFVIDGQPRAYSVRALSYHHVVNDTIGETPIAVAY